MKLQTKFTLFLLSASLTTLVGAQIFQHTIIRKALISYSAENLKSLELREQVHAENIHQTIHPVVQTTIALGEMPKLEALIASYQQIDGLLEYSIYDSKGVAVYSTIRDIVKVKKSLPGDLKDQLLANPNKVSRQTSDVMEIYQPIAVTSKCIECHDTFKQGAIGGVGVLRLSKSALAQAEDKANVTMAGIQSSDVILAIITTLVMAIVVILLTFWTVKRLITTPLMGIITRLKHGAEQLNTSSAEITAASQALAEGANEQAASLEETSTSLEQMSATTKGNAEHSQSVNTLAKQTREAAEKGASHMQEMTAAMEANKAAGGDIAKIIKTIDEIAFQTNILALNASVEAARAGDAGLGFSVVADEVRSLAQRSARAAHETADKIEGAIAKTNQGVEISARVAGTLADIVGRAREVDDLAAKVAAACEQESLGMHQMNLAVSQVEKVTQNNASTAEESARAAEELNAQAEAMRQSVQELVAMLGSGQSAEARRSRPTHGIVTGQNSPSTPRWALAAKQPRRAIPGAKTVIVNSGDFDSDFESGQRRKF